MPEADSTYNPIYKATRILYGKSVMPATITIYGVLGTRTYRGIKPKQAMREYRAEWEENEAAYAECD